MPVGFTSGVVLREWVMVALGSIPALGPIIGLADAVLIFTGNERKTLHDRIAGTKVVDASILFQTDTELERYAAQGDAPRPRRKKRKKKKPAEPAAFAPAVSEAEASESAASSDDSSKPS